MLVLSAGKGQRIIFDLPDGQQMVVFVTEFRNNNKVRLGIDAPQNIRILREKIWKENNHGKEPTCNGRPAAKLL